MTTKKIEQIAKKRGWSVDFHDYFISFRRTSKEGQDFNVEIDIEPEEKGEYGGEYGFWELRSKLIDYYDSFDVDYETYIWLGDDGHGKNGAPYRMIDLWNDMNDFHKKIWKLAMAF